VTVAEGIGITGYGAYLPRLRMARQAIYDANSWLAPALKGKARGHRTLANWDEDSITMAVAAARDCLGGDHDRSHIRELLLASGTLPFAERLNASVVAGALDLGEDIAAADVTGSQASGLTALAQGLDAVVARGHSVLLACSDCRRTLAASAQEMDYGDAGVAVTLGRDNVIAEVVGEAAITVDFVDRFRGAGDDIDYYAEERWIRDEGVGVWMPRLIENALGNARVDAASIDHFIFPSTLRKIQAQLGQKCGIDERAVVDPMASEVGDTGMAHGLLMLARVLEDAEPGQTILITQFGSGGRALVLRVTEAIRDFQPVRGVSGWQARGMQETRYTRLLAYKNQLQMALGPRAEYDDKTALTTAYRHRRALLGLVGGRDPDTGEVSFPPSRLTYTPGASRLDTQEPYPMAERAGRILSWSAESIQPHMAPPHHYGQVDFDGGGRILMEFTDVDLGDIATGIAVEMTFRIKSVDNKRGFTRYFWKATPVSVNAATEQETE